MNRQRHRRPRAAPRAASLLGLVAMALTLCQTAAAAAVKASAAPVATPVNTADGPGLQFTVAHFQPFHGFCYGTLTVTARTIAFDSPTQPDHSFRSSRADLIRIDRGGLMNPRGMLILQFRGRGPARFLLVDRPPKHITMNSAPLLAALNGDLSGSGAVPADAWQANAKPAPRQPAMNLQPNGSPPLAPAGPASAVNQAPASNLARGQLGVSVAMVNPAFASAHGLPPGSAAIYEVKADGPAAKAGLQRGDVVLQLNGQPVTGPADLSPRVAVLAPGSVAHLRIYRNGSTQDLPVTLGHAETMHGESMAGVDNGTRIVAEMLNHVTDPGQISGALYFLTDGNLTVAHMLLNIGADVNTQSMYGTTPLMVAIARGCGPDYVRLLGEPAQDAKRMPCYPVEVARTVSLLLEHGAKSEAHDGNGATPLMRAAQTGNLDVVRLLLAHGADLEARDNKGNSALQYAKNGRGAIMKKAVGNRDMVAFLKAQGLKK